MMKSKKTIELSIELARGIYKSDNEQLKKLVLENFSEEELDDRQKKWEDFGRLSGYYIDDYSDILRTTNPCLVSGNKNRNIRPTIELAQAALALSQLCQWRNKVNDGWRPVWDDKNMKEQISVWGGEIGESSSISINRVMTFKTEEIRDQFMKDHKTLLEIAKPLL